MVEYKYFRDQSLRCRVPVSMMMASDLSRFNDKPFNVNYQWINWKQSDSEERTLSSYGEIYSWVPSVYCEWLIPKLEMTLAIGDTNIENSSWPRTDPWGTKNSQTIVLDRRPSTYTNWDLSLEYELSHCSQIDQIWFFQKVISFFNREVMKVNELTFQMSNGQKFSYRVSE